MLPTWRAEEPQCGRAATQRGATAPGKGSLPLVARILAERTTFSPLAVQSDEQGVPIVEGKTNFGFAS